MQGIAALAADWPALSALLDEALALPAAARAAWLSALPAEHAARRDTLRALLARQAEVETDDFLHTLPRLAPPAAGGLAAGDRVGPYRLIEPLGEGGMGRVWLAERADGLAQRRVALKLPHAAWGGRFAERLAREREILAALAHPHIARLYDAGLDAQGRPYLALELVQGQPIDRYAAQHALPLPARVALLLQVMDAVAHAHAQLVVHRDLKPANILVTPAGQACLLDFGIAKLLDDGQAHATALTELGGRALTPDYASPEQIRGQPLGTASDVYSMGVVAFELLAGARPYRLQRGSAAELEQAIAAQDPPAASSMATGPAQRRALRGDLDAILNRALKKAPAERYPTMEAFAQDLRHWLHGEPVTARPDRWSYRAAKFVRRHRVPVAAGAAVALALVAGTAVALWQAREARLAAAQARTEAATAAAVEAFMQRIFLASSGDQRDAKQARETPARELLDRGAARVDSDLKDAPEVRLKLYGTLAELYHQMGLMAPAQALLRRQVELARERHGARALPTMAALLSQAELEIEADHQPEALALVAQAEAARPPPGSAPPTEWQRLQLALDTTRADALQRQAPAEALPHLARVLAAASPAAWPRERVTALKLQGYTLRRLGRNAEAQAALKEAAAMIERDPALGWNSIVRVVSTLADLQMRAGQRAEADASYARALALLKAGAGSDNDLPVTQDRIAVAHYLNGRYADAAAVSGQAAEWARRQPDDTPLGGYPATLLGNHGRMLTAWGRPEAGLAAIDEGLARIERRRQADGKPAPEHEGPLQAFRVEALVDLGRLAEAGRALARCRELLGDNRSGQIGFLDEAQRRFWVASGRGAEALADFDRQARPTGPDPGAAARWQAQRAALAVAADALDDGLRDARAALAALQADPARPYLRYPEALAQASLGKALLAQGDAAGALPPLQAAEALRRALHDPAQSLALADVLAHEARARSALGDGAGAARALAEAAAIRARHR